MRRIVVLAVLGSTFVLTAERRHLGVRRRQQHRQIAGLVTRGKVTTAQQTQLNGAIGSIRGELGC